MFNYENKKLIIVGDRDGVPGEARKECAETIANVEVIFASTECFVWTAAGAMDLENQKRIKDFATEYGPENLVVILGAAEAEASGLAAETVTMGDPTFSGILANVALGLTTFHVLEDQFKNAVNADVFEEQVGMMEMVLEVEEIVEEMNEIRGEGCKYL